MTPDTRPPRWALVHCCLVLAGVLVGVVVEVTSSPRPTSRAGHRWAALTSPAVARTHLRGLDVVEPAWEVAYDRARDFGAGWADTDGNGCDTRADILHRDLRGATTGDGTDPCLVFTGTLDDPYTGTTIAFDRSDPAAVQIDHVVPLHAAWVLGAWRWTPGRRLAFANDPRNLVAVDGTANQRKGNRLADRWRPPDRRVHCVYAINTVAVHHVHRLPVTDGERRALDRMLGGCP